MWTIPTGAPFSTTNKLVILAIPDDMASIERLIRELDVKDGVLVHDEVVDAVNATVATGRD